MMSKIRSLLVLSISSVIFFGCSNESSKDSSTLILKMPENLEQKAGQVGSLSTKACFAVNIIADDLPKLPASACDSTYGSFAGLIPSGGTVELETKQGSSRTIELYYVLSDTGCSPFDIKQGLGKVFGSNRVFKISKKSGVNFNKAQVSVEMNVEWPSHTNSLASILSSPANCNQADSPLNLMAIKQARLVQGAARGTTANGSTVQIKVLDQKLDMNPPNNWSGRILPNRLGEEL